MLTSVVLVPIDHDARALISFAVTLATAGSRMAVATVPGPMLPRIPQTVAMGQQAAEEGAAMNRKF